MTTIKTTKIVEGNMATINNFDCDDVFNVTIDGEQQSQKLKNLSVNEMRALIAAIESIADEFRKEFP